MISIADLVPSSSMVFSIGAVPDGRPRVAVGENAFEHRHPESTSILSCSHYTQVIGI